MENINEEPKEAPRLTFTSFYTHDKDNPSHPRSEIEASRWLLIDQLSLWCSKTKKKRLRRNVQVGLSAGFRTGLAGLREMWKTTCMVPVVQGTERRRGDLSCA
jgi:hypothetical protein